MYESDLIVIDDLAQSTYLEMGRISHILIVEGGQGFDRIALVEQCSNPKSAGVKTANALALRQEKKQLRQTVIRLIRFAGKLRSSGQGFADEYPLIALAVALDLEQQRQDQCMVGHRQQFMEL